MDDGPQAGYVTDLELPLRGQLHALGNGVVPQQAAYALKILMALAEPGRVKRRGV